MCGVKQSVPSLEPGLGVCVTRLLQEAAEKRFPSAARSRRGESLGGVKQQERNDLEVRFYLFLSPFFLFFLGPDARGCRHPAHGLTTLEEALHKTESINTANKQVYAYALTQPGKGQMSHRDEWEEALPHPHAPLAL